MKSAAQRPRMWTGDISISVMRRWHARACSATADTCTRRRSDKHSQLPDTYGALGKAVRVAVEFRILGDIEALVDGQRLDIGHARQRCVLVCLLVDVNRPVSTDQLIDRVWADELPLKARNALAALHIAIAPAVGCCRRRADLPGAGWLHADGGSVVDRPASVPGLGFPGSRNGRIRPLPRPCSGVQYSCGGVSRSPLSTPHGRTTCESRLGPSGFRRYWIATTRRSTQDCMLSCWGSWRRHCNITLWTSAWPGN